MNGDAWERETVDLLRTSRPSGDIVHAGTFSGDFLPSLARSRTGDARIWAFEPNRESYRCAQVIVILNDLRQVVLTHAALDEKPDGGRLAVRSTDGLALGGGSHWVDRLSGAPDGKTSSSLP